MQRLGGGGGGGGGGAIMRTYLFSTSRHAFANRDANRAPCR